MQKSLPALVARVRRHLGVKGESLWKKYGVVFQNMALVHILIGSGAWLQEDRLWIQALATYFQLLTYKPSHLEYILSLCPYSKMWVMPRRSWDSYNHHVLFIRLLTQINPMVQLITAIMTMIKSHVGHLFFIAKTEENLSFSLTITQICLSSFYRFGISVQVECDVFSDLRRIYFSFRK